jgi:hypothetical protein
MNGSLGQGPTKSPIVCAGRFEVMRGKGHVVDPENIRPPAGSSILLKIGVVAHASSSRWPR